MTFFSSFPNIHLHIYSFLKNKDKYSYFNIIKYNECHRNFIITFDEKDFISIIQNSNINKFSFYYYFLDKKDKQYIKYLIMLSTDIFLYNIIKKYKLDLSMNNYYFLKQLQYKNPLLYDMYIYKKLKYN